MTTETDPALRALAERAMATAVRGAMAYLREHHLEASDADVGAAVLEEVRNTWRAAVADAKQATDSLLPPEIATQTFLASMVLAGIAAAKRVGKLVQA